VLPPAYPLRNPPEITLIRATHVWLPETQTLQAELLNLWQAGEPVLYNWVEFIRTGEFLQKMNLLSSVSSDLIACVKLLDFSSIVAQLYLKASTSCTAHNRAITLGVRHIFNKQRICTKFVSLLSLPDTFEGVQMFTVNM